jgi:hypothetical protein
MIAIIHPYAKASRRGEMTGVAIGGGSRRACAIHEIHSQVLCGGANERRKEDTHF